MAGAEAAGIRSEVSGLVSPANKFRARAVDELEKAVQGAQVITNKDEQKGKQKAIVRAEKVPPKKEGVVV